MPGSSGIHFVQETGTKEDDKTQRKLIRRHVMLGKNRGRTQPSKLPAIEGVSVFRQDDWCPVTQLLPQTQVPQRVGTDLSFLTFADEVDHSLLSATLRFCSATHKNLFVLEPCIAFPCTDIPAMCLQALTHDALYLNVMVFGTQRYIDYVVWQGIPGGVRGRCITGLQHYDRALCLLRKRVADAVREGSNISDITILAILPLALYNLMTGELENARSHIVGLSRLLKMREGGMYSFRRRTKQLVEILRGDLTVCLATGQTPIFFSESPNELDVLRLEVEVETGDPDDKPFNGRITTSNTSLSKIFNILYRFCVMINSAAANQTKLSEEAVLEPIPAAMYRLLHLSTLSSPLDETLRLAALAFCASAFVSWRQLRLPSMWLQSEFKNCLTWLMRRRRADLDPRMMLWFVTMYAVTFSPFSMQEDGEEVQRWLMEFIELSGLGSWEEVKRCVAEILWIDIVCDHRARKFVNDALARLRLRVVAIDMFDVLC